MPGSLDPDATLADLSEDALLALIVPLLGGGPASGLGPGDDAAVVPAPDGSVVATTDAMVRGRDWRDAWSTGADVGAKAVAQNLADIAAMGARPTGLLVTLVADPATPVAWALAFARGLGEAAQAARTPVLGGDLSSAPAGTLLACVTALGCLDGRAPVLRSGARPGHAVAVAGTLGLAAAGWQLLEAGRPDAHPQAVACQLRPTPPVWLGPAAATAGASAMLDVSDGLLRDAARLADASGVRLDFDAVALQADVDRIVPALGAEQALECVLAGGEEHSLLATFPGALPDGWRLVGRVSKGTGVTVGGTRQQPRGWDHFAGYAGYAG
ncbi:MAG: thiamine-phosphate kinase [Dermatophilaceae bacterium]